MPPRGCLSQDRVFYTGEWNREIDDIFVRALTEQTVVGNWIVRGNANRRAITYCRDRVNAAFGTKFDYNVCLERFNKLYKRYQVFQYIIEFPGVVHNEQNHVVQADDATWDAICAVHPLARVYMRQGEQEYDTLRFVFNALPDVPRQGGEIVEVIQISSDTDGISVGNDSSTSVEDNANERRARGTTALGRRTREGTPRASPPPHSGPSSVASSSPFKNI